MKEARNRFENLNKKNLFNCMYGTHHVQDIDNSTIKLN
jgi:hypothetical protein